MVEVSLKGEVAIVMGSGRGIGRAIALKLAAAGADVIVADILELEVESVSDEIKALGVKSKAYVVDVTKENQVNDMVDDVAKEFGSIDIMVNNVGFNSIKTFLDSDSEEFSKMIDINLKGVYYGSKAAAKHMVEKGKGRIVNTSSVAGLSPALYHSMYCATKYGVRGLSHVMALELGQYGITVNCLCPGIVRTDMWEQNLNELDRYGISERDSKEAFFNETVHAAIPMKRPQTVEDMANAVLFLCSDMAKNVSGLSLSVSGAQVCL